MNFKTVIFFLSQTQIPLSGLRYFFQLSQPFFRIFFPIKPTQWRSLSDSWKHKVPQSILKSSPRYHRYNRFSKSFIFSSVIQELQKYVIASKIDFTVTPLKKTFTDSARPVVPFIFKNVFFFIYCTEQNIKEIIWLRCYLLIKDEEAFLNGIAVQRI